MKYLKSFEAKKWSRDFPTIKKFDEIEDTEEDTEETPLNTKEEDDRTPCIYCGSKDHMWAACPIYISTQIINQSTMF